MKTGALILAGGHSARMNGIRKENIVWGNTTFLGLLCSRLWTFEEKLISVGKGQTLEMDPWKIVEDEKEDQGPLSGLIQGLSCCASQALFVVSCDMPFLPPQLPDLLLEAMDQNSYDACICQDQTGRLFPLCAVYSKQALPVLRQALESGDRKVMNALKGLNLGILPLNRTLLNLNTPGQVQELFKRMYRLDLEEAQRRILQSVSSPLELQSCPLKQCRGRILAQDITAPMDNPPFSRSALDGYAVRKADIQGASSQNPVRLPVDGTLFAGPCAPCFLAPGHAMRIMTGAVMPEGADYVIRQEDTDQGQDQVSVFVSGSSRPNYASQGEDIQKGTLLLEAGCRIGPAEMGILASMGIQEVPVRRRPRVALLSTGDELSLPGTPLERGKIYNSSLFVLAAKLEELGTEPVMIRMLKDDPQAAALEIRRIAGEKTADLIITTGGVSVGQKDIFHQTVPMSQGELIFWRLKIKPGSPVMFWKLDDLPVLSLSGNPFAAFATFELLARPLIGKLLGSDQVLMKQGEGILSGSFQCHAGLRRFVRARCQDGMITLPQGHSSGMLLSLKGCNCLVDIPEGVTSLNPGDRVRILVDPSA